MAEILTGARKYRVGLTLAHQELRQLARDSEIYSAVLANSYTRICFRVGDTDARTLANGFSAFESKDLQNLGTGQAVCRVERSNYDFNLSVPYPTYHDETKSVEIREKVIETSRSKYGTPRDEISAISGNSSFKEQVDTTDIPKSTATPERISKQPPTERSKKTDQSIQKPKTSASQSTPGRGGAQHKEIQMRI